MSITSRITRNFQVTIPSDIRKELSLHEGDVLAFGVTGGKLIAFPVKKAGEDKTSPTSKEWQKKEKRADKEIKESDVFGPFDDLEKAFRFLDEPIKE